jgi:hypothetical protein
MKKDLFYTVWNINMGVVRKLPYVIHLYNDNYWTTDIFFFMFFGVPAGQCGPSTLYKIIPVSSVFLSLFSICKFAFINIRMFVYNSIVCFLVFILVDFPKDY